MTPPRARFGGIDIVPQDMAKSVEFYRELGMDIPDSEIWIENGVMHHVGLHVKDEFAFDIDSAKLTASYAREWTGDRGVVLIFSTDSREDVDALHDHMVGLGHPSHTPPFDAFWGARYAILVDPGGNLVSLMSPMDKSLGGPPPAV